MTAMQWIVLFGAIGLFLCGMNLLGTAMAKSAGPKMEKLLEKTADGKRGGVFLGMGVAAAIQSSSATSVMTIGFINSAGMRMAQGVLVMMGANIGATFIGHLLRLGDIPADCLLAFARPEILSPVCIALGAAVHLMSRKEMFRHIAALLTGFGVLLVGMASMEAAFVPFVGRMPAGLKIFLTNPMGGFLAGVVATALLQSTSVSVGVLQAVCAAGVVPFEAAAGLIVGMNVGRFIPVMISSGHMSKRAVRTVGVSIVLNLLMAAVFLAALLVFQAAGMAFWPETVGRGGAADINTLFNLAAAVIALPLCGTLVRLSGRLFPGEDGGRDNQELSRLDTNFLKTPAVALNQCQKVAVFMGETARENFSMAITALKKPTATLFNRINDNEKFLDRAESRMGEYLVQITSRGLERDNSRLATQITYAVGDFERIGDYSVNLAEVAEYKRDHHIRFSDAGWHEMGHLFDATSEILDMTIRAFAETSVHWAECVEPLEETIDSMVEELKQRHLERLQRGECDISRDISFSEIVTAVERISDHCSNIAVNVLKRASDSEDFDAHAQLESLHQQQNRRYNELFHAYMEKYRNIL